MATPLQITAGATRRAHFTTEDIPGKVFQPGEKGYHGPRVGANRRRTTYDTPEEAARRANRDNPHHPDNNPNRPGTRGFGALTAGVAAAPVLAGASIIPVARHNWKKRENEARARLAQVNKEWKGDKDTREFFAEDPGIRHAKHTDGAWRVNSMKPPLDRHPLARLGRAAMKHESLPPALMGAGMLAGVGVAAAGINGPKRRAERAQLDLRNARARATRAQRKQPVTKRVPGAAAARRSFGTPRKAAATLKSNPQLLAFGGTGAVAAASGPATRHADQRVRDRRDQAARAVYGGIAGQTAYQAGIHGSNYRANRKFSTIFKDPKNNRGYKRTDQKKIVEGHKKTYGLNNPKIHSNHEGYYRNFPTSIPGGKHFRVNAHLSTGTRGFAVGSAATLGGAMLAGHRGHGRKQNVEKALYERTSRPSLLRTGEAAAGAGLLLWGAGRSRMVGSALGRGIKMAESRGSARAVEALQRAQAAQGSLRRGTAPAERTLRQIRAVDRAVRAVPSPLRGDVATAAGLLLVGNAHPINRNTYRPIPSPTPVPYRTVGW